MAKKQSSFRREENERKTLETSEKNYKNRNNNFQQGTKDVKKYF